ncbi:sensor histidine kinase [Embleya sp. AB8]|uniref:sensor histidine kinase n=1 Tax=Embleya sp. AB8 TaxID=3156304 RepID=UPI003C789BC9
MLQGSWSPPPSRNSRTPLPLRWSALAATRAGRYTIGGCTAVLWSALHVFLYLVPEPFAHVTMWAGAATAVLLALPVGPVRRWPVPVLGVLLAESIVVLLLRDRAWPLFPAIAVLIGHLAATGPRRVGVAAAVLVPGVWAGVFVGRSLTVDQGNDGVGDVLSQLAAAGAVVGIGWLIGDAIRRRREYRADLHAAAAARAVLAERLRIARELHDMVAHSIGVIAIQAGAASLVLDTRPAGARKAIDTIEATSRETLAELRRMLVSLRRADSDADGDGGSESGREVPGVGLEGVDRLAANTADAGMRVEVVWRGARRPLPPEVDLAAFRIIQEAVTNALRHSGTRRCRVSVEYLDAELAIEVVDDGTADPARAVAPGGGGGGGLGISGMRERVALVHGRFSAGARPEGGFRVAARLPA